MAVKASNLTLGAGTLYIANFGAVEPADAVVAPAPAVWTDLGATLDGTTFSVAQEFTELTADQVIDRLESRMTSRTITLQTNLAETTLGNLKIALSGGTVTNATGKSTYDAAIASNLVTNYSAILLDTPAPNSKRRRLILRKALSTDAVEIANSKDSQTVYTVTFTGHFVDDVKSPFTIVDEVATV